MGFNYEQYKEELSNATGELASVSSADPYAYAMGTSDDYNYASGCGALHPFNKAKREACEKAKSEKKQAKLDLKISSAESDKKLAEAALISANKPETQMSPLAITGIIVGSLLAITVMVIVIKKVKK